MPWKWHVRFLEGESSRGPTYLDGISDLLYIASQKTKSKQAKKSKRVIYNRLENKWAIHGQTEKKMKGWTRHCSNNVRRSVNRDEMSIKFVNS